MTANPRTKIVTDYDVEKLADNYGRLHGCYFLPHQNACELCKREAADFLASLPDAPTPEEKPMGFGYCPMCCHALNQCSHCDAPTEDPEPSHDFKPTEFGGDTCERCDKDVRSHLLPDAPTPTLTRNAVIEECAQVVLNGSFLHDEAPTALFAKECAAAIRRLIVADAPTTGSEPVAWRVDPDVIAAQVKLLDEYGVESSHDRDLVEDLCKVVAKCAAPERDGPEAG
jgi:hypothetical protein